MSSIRARKYVNLKLHAVKNASYMYDGLQDVPILSWCNKMVTLINNMLCSAFWRHNERGGEDAAKRLQIQHIQAQGAASFDKQT